MWVPCLISDQPEFTNLLPTPPDRRFLLAGVLILDALLGISRFRHQGNPGAQFLRPEA